jgi:hypothetical protein
MVALVQKGQEYGFLMHLVCCPWGNWPVYFVYRSAAEQGCHWDRAASGASEWR